MSDQAPLMRAADVLWRAGCGVTRTSGSVGGSEQTASRKRGMAACSRPYLSRLPITWRTVTTCAEPCSPWGRRCQRSSDIEMPLHIACSR